MSTVKPVKPSNLLATDRSMRYAFHQQDSEAILRSIEHYDDARAASIDALKIVQKRHGWVPDEAIAAIAGILEIPAADVEGVATFYNLIFRKPVGRHVILICNSVSCFVMGYPGLREHLRARLGIDFGETTADGRFTLLPMVCLGDCDRAPAMMIDDHLYDELTPAKIDEALARHPE